MKLLLFGATGLVGKNILLQALENPVVDLVIAPTRRPLTLQHKKLMNVVVNFDNLPPDAEWWGADAALCAMGTTIKAAGTREAFRKVDHDYPLVVARHARTHGVKSFALVSAKGANARAPFFYARVKGELEVDVEALGFPSLTIARPGLIGGERSESRRAEHFTAAMLGLLEPILPKSWRVNPAPKIAEVLLKAVLTGSPGTKIIDSFEMI